MATRHGILGTDGDTPVLLLDDVHKVYNPGPLQVHVLKGISLAVEEGPGSARD